MLKKLVIFLVSIVFLWSCSMDIQLDSTMDTEGVQSVRAVEMGEESEVLSLVKSDEGDLTFSVLFDEPKTFVQLFVKKSGVQYLVPTITSSEVEDSYYTYSYTESGDSYESTDTVEFRFYSFNGSNQVFSPGPGESDWSESYSYADIDDGANDTIEVGEEETEESEESSGSYLLDTVYIEPVDVSNARFSITLSEQKSHVYLFACSNGLQNYVVIDLQESGEVANSDGTYTYESTRSASYEEGDLLEARFYTYSGDSGQIFYPGPDAEDFTSYTYGDDVVYGSDDTITDPIDDADDADDADDEDVEDTEEDETDDLLIALDSGMEMTYQFINSSNEYTDDQIYLTILARDSNSDWCYLQPDGTMVTLEAGDSSEEWTYCLADIEGFQVPSNTSSGRAYFSYLEPVVMSAITDGVGDVGIVQPNMADSGDVNQDVYFEWFEFTVGDGAYWGNTTQVDQYCFSYTKSLYGGSDGGFLDKVGIDQTRDDIFASFESIVPSEFQVLVQEPYRILAPCKAEGGFGDGDTYGTYMDDYVDEVWDFLTTEHVVIDHPLGRYVSEIGTGDSLTFYKYSTTETDFSEENITGGPYYITDKPNGNELFEGSGVLASGDTDELCIQAWMCAALNRHNATTWEDYLGGYKLADWNNEETYYPEDYNDNPANHYSRFWHENSIDGRAYGFCYDDVNDQATLLYTYDDPRAVVIEMFWN